MHSDLEIRVRGKLAAYALDGTEAVERIILMLHSPSRPADLRRALGSILQSAYRNTVPIDAAIEVLLEEIEQTPEWES